MTPSRFPSLDQLRCVNRRTGEFVGPCPWCGGDPRRSTRFHLWTQPTGSRPAQRYWCRRCNVSGRLHADPATSPRWTPPPPKPAPDQPTPIPAHQAHYRAIYAWVAAWAAHRLWEPADPEPLQYLQGRGIADAVIRTAQLGSTPRDAHQLVATLTHARPDLAPFLVEAGVARLTSDGQIETHPTLRGRVLFPYRSAETVYDLRARAVHTKGYRALPGAYVDRGAVMPFGLDLIPPDAPRVLLTEAEIKALVATSAFQQGALPIPTIGQPGLNVCRPEWANLLRARGVHTVVLAYDQRRRQPADDGTLRLTPEEYWTIRHGLLLAEQGLTVQVLRLPILPGDDHGELDRAVLADQGGQLAARLAAATPLSDVHRSLPPRLLAAQRLPVPDQLPRTIWPVALPAQPAADQRATPGNLHHAVGPSSTIGPVVSPAPPVADQRATPSHLHHAAEPSPTIGPVVSSAPSTADQRATPDSDNDNADLPHAGLLSVPSIALALEHLARLRCARAAPPPLLLSNGWADCRTAPVIPRSVAHFRQLEDLAPLHQVPNAALLPFARTAPPDLARLATAAHACAAHVGDGLLTLALLRDLLHDADPTLLDPERARQLARHARARPSSPVQQLILALAASLAVPDAPPVALTASRSRWYHRPRPNLAAIFRPDRPIVVVDPTGCVAPLLGALVPGLRLTTSPLVPLTIQTQVLVPAALLSPHPADALRPMTRRALERALGGPPPGPLIVAPAPALRRLNGLIAALFPVGSAPVIEHRASIVHDHNGQAWRMHIPTYRDPGHQHLLQCTLAHAVWRALDDHPAPPAHITLCSDRPIPGITPQTTVVALGRLSRAEG